MKDEVYDELRIPLVARIAGVVQMFAGLALASAGFEVVAYLGLWGALAGLPVVFLGFVGFALGGWLTQGRGIAAVLAVGLDLLATVGLLAWFVAAMIAFDTVRLLPLFASMFTGSALLLVAIATPGSIRLDRARRDVLK